LPGTAEHESHAEVQGVGGGEGGGEGGLVAVPSHWQAPSRSHGQYLYPIAHFAQSPSFAQALLLGTAEHESHAEVQGVGPGGGEGDGGGDGGGGGDGEGGGDGGCLGCGCGEGGEGGEGGWRGVAVAAVSHAVFAALSRSACGSSDASHHIMPARPRDCAYSALAAIEMGSSYVTNMPLAA
jgi:hypothetical protein